MAEIIVVAAVFATAVGTAGAAFYGAAAAYQMSKKRRHAHSLLKTGVCYKHPGVVSHPEKGQVRKQLKRLKQRVSRRSKEEIHVFSDGHIEARGLTSYAANDCSICLEDLQAGDRMVLLLCGHTMHMNCAKQWLKSHNTCPLCKADLVRLAYNHNYNVLQHEGQSQITRDSTFETGVSNQDVRISGNSDSTIIYSTDENNIENDRESAEIGELPAYFDHLEMIPENSDEHLYSIDSTDSSRCSTNSQLQSNGSCNVDIANSHSCCCDSSNDYQHTDAQCETLAYLRRPSILNMAPMA